VDMRRHLNRRMTNGDLEQMGGDYEGVIAEVVMEDMRNRYTSKREEHPVIVFEDGWRIVPNIGIRQALINSLKAESDDWIGGRIRIFLRPMPRKDGSGDGPQRFEKAVECLAPETVKPKKTERAELVADEISWR
jgi:hypothetical protein